MLQDIIKHLKDVCRKESLDADSNTILEMGVKIMISNQIDKSHKEMYQKPKINEIKPTSALDKTILASDKQKSLMTKLKIPFTKNTTISEAKDLIELKLGKKEY